jgi:CheY-like chemotaxis protein
LIGIWGESPTKKNLRAILPWTIFPPKERGMRNTHWKVLIVDDDANDRALLQRSLLQFNGTLQVREVNDGEEAIRYLNGDGDYADRNNFPFPTFIFIDLKMPKLDGFAVLGHLKKNPQWAVIPTLIFSSSADP